VVESQGAISAKEDDILERDGKVASLPPLPPQTFTAFSAYFPQSRAFGAVDAPRLVTSTAAPMKDAG